MTFLTKLHRWISSTLLPPQKNDTNNEADTQQKRREYAKKLLSFTLLFLLFSRKFKPLIHKLLKRPKPQLLQEMPISHLLHLASSNEISKAIISLTNNIVTYSVTTPSSTSSSFNFNAYLPASLTPSIIKSLSNVPILQISKPPVSSKISSTLLIALPFIYLGLMYKMMKNLYSDVDGKDGDGVSKKVSERSERGFWKTRILATPKLTYETIVIPLNSFSHLLRSAAQQILSLRFNDLLRHCRCGRRESSAYRHR